MSANYTDLEKKLWTAADGLRANSKLKASEYSAPVLGLIFLRFADNKFSQVQQKLLQSSGGYTPDKTDYQEQGVMFLPEAARYSHLLKLSEDEDIAKAITDAMKAIEAENEELAGMLPKQYNQLDKSTLVALLKTFSSIPVDVEGDFFGKVYEYFLGKFAMSEGQRGGEFFTPTSIVKLIVEIIEPFHGRIFDPACGSGGMFVQSANFVEKHKHNPGVDISVYGQEKTQDTVKLCKMNLAVHGLSGDIKRANTYYENVHKCLGRFDFVMANPPFNVNGVEKEKIKGDPRYPFGMPRTDNANYLWIQEFYSALNERGRAGFVMANSASDARGSELDIRQKLIEAQVVDVMVSVGSNFFYTVTLPCTLWFFDKGKHESERRDNVLFLDARAIYRQLDRAHRDFTPDQIELLANIVRLYRGEAPEAYNGSTARMQELFPDGTYADIAGLCRVATLQEIETQGWSLNPGRYVGIEQLATDTPTAKRTKVFKDWSLNPNSYRGNEQSATDTPTVERTKVFISYCHRNKKYFERLRIHLNFLERNGGIDIWDDTKIKSGEEWHKEIDKALSYAKVAILLVSADFLASKFIAEDELPPLLKAAKEAKAIILPVVLSPCAFEDSQIADYESVNDPLKPLSGMSYTHKENLWNDVAKRIKEIFKQSC